jgi:hypothetical protein
MLTLSILATVDPHRLLKATEALVNGSLTVTLTNVDAESIEGFVKNGDNVEYSVVLTPSRTFCSCRDAMFRRGICKHQAILSLYALRHGAVAEVEEKAPAPNLKLGKARAGFAG